MDARDGDFAVESVCTLPPGRPVEAVTSDGHVVSFWPRPEGRLRFAWDGHAAMQTFDGLVDRRDKSPLIVPSADGAHLAYVGIRDGQQFVGRDAGEDPPFESISHSVPPTFSPDGRHLAYGGGTHEEFRLILDGQRASEQPIAPIQAVFSPDGSRLAYVELRPVDDRNHEVRVILDGTPGPWLAGMRNETGVLQFSPDGRRFAYREHDRDLKVRWVVDGAPQQWAADPITLRQAFKRVSARVAAIEEPVLAAFSPDSRRFAYFADVPEKGVAIVEDDVPGPLFKAVGMPVFSPDSAHLAYVAETFAKQWIVVVDGAPGPAFPASSAGIPVFSIDGRHVAVTFGREAGNILRKRTFYGVVVDGRVEAEFEAGDVSLLPAFSPDGAQVAWWVRRGEVSDVMINGSMHSDLAIALSDPVYTPSGHLVYEAILVPDGPVQRDAVATVLVDGRPGPTASLVMNRQSTVALFGRPPTRWATLSFAVSPDGDHVAWAGLFGDESRPVIDDRVGPAFDRVLDWAFDGSGIATWWAQRSDVVYKVTA